MQPVAICGKPTSRENGSNKPNSLPSIAASGEHNDGKKGVDGSSPSEGFAKSDAAPRPQAELGFRGTGESLCEGLRERFLACTR